VNQQHIMAIHLNLQTSEIFYVTREVYVVTITQVETKCASLTLNTNLFFHCLF
jgi:hypothetical protein